MSDLFVSPLRRCECGALATRPERSPALCGVCWGKLPKEERAAILAGQAFVEPTVAARPTSPPTPLPPLRIGDVPLAALEFAGQTYQRVLASTRSPDRAQEAYTVVLLSARRGYAS